VNEKHALIVQRQQPDLREKLFHLTYRYIFCFSISAPFSWGTQGRADTAPKASGCILGGTQKDLEGGTGKAEDAKLPGAGIIPKLCPRKERRKWSYIIKIKSEKSSGWSTG
jgi:hypothetical protein